MAFPQNLDCSTVVDPESTIAGVRPGDLTIALPADVATTVLVDIDCTNEDVAAVTLPANTVNTVPAAPVETTTAPPAAVDTTTTAPPAAVTTTTVAPAAAVTTTAVASQVASTESVPVAPAAQPRVGTPTFTG